MFWNLFDIKISQMIMEYLGVIGEHKHPFIFTLKTPDIIYFLG